MSTRRGFTLLEIAMVMVVLTVGILAASRFVTAVVDQLAPGQAHGGLRRYLHAEEMLNAQCEGLRALRSISPVADSNRLVQEPPGSPYALRLTQTVTAPDTAPLQLVVMDVTVWHQGQAIGTLSVSTLRSLVGGQHEKIGL